MALSTTLVLSLLLLLLPPALCRYLSPSPAAGHLSKHLHAGGGGFVVDGDEVNPVILLAGMSCSDIEARLTDEYRPTLPHCGKMKGKGWFGLWNNASDLGGQHDYVDCFLEQMRLVYDPAVNDYRNLPGVETRVPYFGSTRGFSQKNPAMPEWCLGKMIATLESMGYRDGDTLYGAPYDFRYAPPSTSAGQKSEVYSRYFKEFMDLVETVTAKKQRKAVILGHSFGGTVALEFLRSTPLSWRNEHIQRLILVAAPTSGGFLEPVSNFASGTNIFYLPISSSLETTTRAMWRTFESAIINFPSPAVFGRRRPVVVTAERNYTADDMERFLVDVGCGEAVEPFRRRAVPKMDNFVAPMVPLTYINGVGNETPLELLFADVSGSSGGNCFDASPEDVAYGDGDGKINLISVQAFDKEMRRQPGQSQRFKSIKIEKAQHSTIVTDDSSLQMVIQEILEASTSSSDKHIAS